MLIEKINRQMVAVEARTFESLMDLYEDNYMKIRRLIPNIDAVKLGAISRVSGTIPLFLKVIEFQKYTTTFQLTYRFEGKGDKVHHDPAMMIRVYHDARTAEAMLDHNARLFNIDILSPQRTDVSLKARWEMNHFLNRWLQYCLSEGHSFDIQGYSTEDTIEYA